MGFRKKLASANLEEITHNFFIKSLGEKNAMLYCELYGITKAVNVNKRDLIDSYHWKDFSECFLSIASEYVSNHFQEHFNQKNNGLKKPQLRPSADDYFENRFHNKFEELKAILTQLGRKEKLHDKYLPVFPRVDEIMIDARIILFESENPLPEKFKKPFEKIQERLIYMQKAYFAEHKLGDALTRN